ncbi:MAG: hypothetical protein ACRD1C_08495 [Terriglobales bacterium]
MSPRLTRFRTGVVIALAGGLALTQAPVRLNPSPGGDHPQARADWFMRFRQSRDALSPAAHRYEAWQQARRMRVRNPSAQRRQLAMGAASPPVVSGDWTSLGPQPESDPNYGDVAGRLTALAVDVGKDSSGNTVYLGAADGGLWESTNALSANPTFTPIGDNLPSLAIGSIALDDSTIPTTIYVGTGEPNLSQDSYYGDGVFKSSDGGQTWASGTGTDFLGSAISRLLIDPTNPQILLAAVTEGGVYTNNNFATSAPAIGIVRSSDAGATWTQVFTGGPASGTDIIYDAADQDYYAAIRAKGFYRSTDRGQTWAALPSPIPVAPSSQNFYRASLALRGTTLFALISDSSGKPTGSEDCSGCTGLVQSTNEGQSWQALNLPPNLYGSNNQGTYDQYLAAPPNSSNLVVGGIDAWLGTPQGSGGLSWTNLTNAYSTGSVHPDEHAIGCLSANSWIIANDGGAWSTANAGASWSNMNATLDTIQFYSISSALRGTILGGSQDNGTALITPAGGAVWNNMFGGDGGHTAINPANPSQYFTENFGVSLQRSDSSGQSWTPVVDSTTITDVGEFYIPFVLAPADPSTAYLLTQRVWRGPTAPTTEGAGWKAISPPLIYPPVGMDSSADNLTALAAAPNAPSVLYVGAYDGSLSVSSDVTNTLAQPTWTTVQPGANPYAGPVTAIAVSPASPQTVYWGLGFVGPSAAMFKSSDGGKTAVNISGNLPGTPINAIVVDPSAPNNIYIATDVGVFETSDGGVANEQWSLWGGNLPAVAVLSLVLSRDNNDNPVVLAGTHGRGAWSIAAASPPGFAFTASPAQPVVTQGTDGMALTLQPSFADGFTGPVSWSCSSTAALQCGFTPATSAPGGGDTSVNISGLASAAASGDIPLTITATSGSTQFSEQLTLANNGDFNLSAQPGAVTLAAANNHQAPVALIFATSNGLSLNVTLACSGLPAGYTCQLPAASVAISNASSATVMIAPAAVAAATPPGRDPGGTAWPWLLAGALLAGAAYSLRRKPVLAGALLLVLAGAACGGGSPGLVPVASTVTLTATAAPAGAPQPLVHSTTVVVTVE